MSERKGTKALELWCKRLVKDCPDVRIDNMTTSWRNGIAFCALVHHFRPDLIDMSALRPEDIYENNQLAFSIAEKHLGIPALLDPEDMVENDVPDRLSVLTYLSQFYQRLGHTVNTKATENEAKSLTPSTGQSSAPLKFGKTGLDKCAACGLPVYLAQRLMVSYKLYHRRCFRCSKCSGHLNPKNFEVIEGSEFYCDSCKNDKMLSKFLNNNDQMGMLAFSDDLPESQPETQTEEPISPKHKSRPQSILEKISIFENNIDKDTNIENRLSNLSLNDNFNDKHKDINAASITTNTSAQSNNIEPTPVERIQTEKDSKSLTEVGNSNMENKSSLYKNIPEPVYKSNLNKFNFLQTQLSGDAIDLETTDDLDVVVAKQNKEDYTYNEITAEIKDNSKVVRKDESNITDDTRIAKTHNISSKPNNFPPFETDSSKSEKEISISVPPRKKKLQTLEKQSANATKLDVSVKSDIEYPDDLNPFSDDDDEKDVEQKVDMPKKESTNPFGSSDEEDDDVPPIQSPPKLSSVQTATPVKRLISANPFWSDGEEPTTDEEAEDTSPKPYKSSIATSTPNLPACTPRRKKAKAPPPPPVVRVAAPAPLPASDQTCTSMDDIASISSFSSFNSTIHSDQKLTPKMKRLAPTPLDSVSTASGSMERGVDAVGRGNSFDGGRKKGPAPGLPLPERREVKLQMSPEQLQVQLDMLETQQLGLERQGVLIEQMIRDKCEGDEASVVPQEEVEDLVIQLCELVNEKNDLFRKQTELMYIRRQQRLEQEQADIEHEIRVIQSRPAVNRIDADKAREEQLVSRLVQIVRMRDELVQQIDAERRRERQEDLAIAVSIATKRAQRNSESNSSSIKSVEAVATPKKNKVKDKVKKQLKKAKHSLIPRKKEDSGDRKEEKVEKKSK